MAEQSTNRPTFLMYDGVGSSKAALSLPYALYRSEMLGRLYALTEKLVTDNKGRQCSEPHGDDCLAVFPTAADAAACAVALQGATKSLTVKDTAGTEYTFFIRLVAHTATQDCIPDAKGNYQNHPDIIFAARVLPLACAGQILLTQSAKDAGVLPYADKPHPNRRIRNFEQEPHILYELLYDDVERGEPGSLYLPGWFQEANKYIARPTLEKQIDALFQERTTSNFPYRIVTLHGFGGMGKSRLAYQSAINAAGLFGDRMFLARLGDRFSDSLLSGEIQRRDALHVALLHAFTIPADPPIPPEQLPARVAQKMAEKQPSGPALLLLDNWETVQGTASIRLVEAILEASPELRVLATGRERLNSRQERAWNVAELLPEEAEALLWERIREGSEDGGELTEEDTPSIARILELTSCIPLAIELVAAHCAVGNMARIAADLEKDILGRRASRPKHLLPDEKTDRHESLENCLHWSWKLLPDDEKNALACLSLFADECKTEEILSCFPFLEEERMTGLALASLAVFSRPKDAYSLLRPVREYARRRLNEMDEEGAWQKTFIARYVEIAQENGGQGNQEEKAKRDILEAAWPHARNAVELAAEREDGLSAGQITGWYMHYLYRQARYVEAALISEKALKAQQASLPDRHPDIAQSLNNLAGLYRSQGRYAEAEPLYKQALEIDRTALGENHPGYATDLNNLAGLYDSQGRYAEAEPLYKQALEISRKALPDGHPTIAIRLNNLAELYRSQGRYAEAEPLFKQALTIIEKALGREHPNTRIVRKNYELFLEEQKSRNRSRQDK